jgi:hypothetical protein
MRTAAFALALLVGFVGGDFRRAVPKAKSVSFDTDVAPILARKCTPCHYAGGKMYDRLHFERPETIVKLGERLFTRIKDERERATIRKFLEARR